MSAEAVVVVESAGKTSGWGERGGERKRERERERVRPNEASGYPKGCAAPGVVPCQCNTRECLSKLKAASPQRKIDVTSKSPVGDISVVTLIRTDTTLDHSQKAEKVCFKTRGSWRCSLSAHLHL